MTFFNLNIIIHKGIDEKYQNGLSFEANCSENEEGMALLVCNQPPVS
jgi:hypothetical protein